MCARHLDRCRKWQHADSSPPAPCLYLIRYIRSLLVDRAFAGQAFGTNSSFLCCAQAFLRAGKQVCLLVQLLQAFCQRCRKQESPTSPPPAGESSHKAHVLLAVYLCFLIYEILQISQQKKKVYHYNFLQSKVSSLLFLSHQSVSLGPGGMHLVS